MLMRKVVEVFGNQEEMEDTLVDKLEVWDRLACFGVKDGEAEAYFLAGFGIAGSGGETNGILDRIGKAGHELHAAAGATTGSFLPDIGIHRADEFDWLFGWFLSQGSESAREEEASGGHG
jgi:hypothetical protein